MKRLLPCLLAMVCFFLAGVQAALAEEESNVRIGYVLPDARTSAPDSMRQYYVSYLDELAKYADWKYQMIEVSPDEGFDALERGAIDLLLPVEYNPSRAGKTVAYSQFTSYYDIVGLFTRPEERRFVPSRPLTLNHASVGMLAGREANDLFRHFLAHNGLEADLHEYADKAEMMDALASGKVDLVVDTATNTSPGEHYLMGFEVIPARIASTPGRAWLIDELDRAAERVREENPGYDTMLLREAYQQTRHIVANFTPAQSEFITSGAPLRVAVFGERLPYVSYDPVADVVAGIYPDILRAIGHDSGLNFAFVHTETYDDAVQMLKDGKADIFIDIYTNDDAMRDFYYTTPIYTEDYSLVSRQQMMSLDLPGSLVLPLGLPSAVAYVKKEMPHWRIDVRSSVADSLKAVDDGEADLVAVDALSLQAERPIMHYPSLSVIPTYEMHMPICLVISRHQPRMLQGILNKAILRLDPHAVDQIVLQYTIAAMPRLSLSHILHYYPLQSGLSIGFVLLLMASAAFLFHNNRQNRMQRELLAEKNAVLTATLAALNDASAARDSYKYKAETDMLTGVLNKAAIEAFIREALAHAPSPDAPDALFILDLDHFKEANDTKGHQFGDDILSQFARALQGIVRENDMIGRFGGDEFVLYCQSIQQDALPRIAERISKAAHDLAPEQIPPISVSIGIAISPQHGTSYEDLFRAADRALYWVKEHGRDNFRINGQGQNEENPAG